MSDFQQAADEHIPDEVLEEVTAEDLEALREARENADPVWVAEAEAVDEFADYGRPPGEPDGTDDADAPADSEGS